jgi:hypothetical protein
MWVLPQAMVSIGACKIALVNPNWYRYDLNNRQTVPRSQDVETPSHYGSNPVSYIANAGGGTRSDSEFRRPAIWAQVSV